jgi:hypothetical protein
MDQEKMRETLKGLSDEQLNEVLMRLLERRVRQEMQRHPELTPRMAIKLVWAAVRQGGRGDIDAGGDQEWGV